MNARDHDRDRNIRSVAAAWSELRNLAPIGVISSRSQYDTMVKLMDELLDRSDQDHEMAQLLDLVGALVERWEDEQVHIPLGSPRETLRFLMEQHGLRQTDLRAELGSQGIVSEVLNGKREINARQAKALAVRFNVSPAVFL